MDMIVYSPTLTHKKDFVEAREVSDAKPPQTFAEKHCVSFNLMNWFTICGRSPKKL